MDAINVSEYTDNYRVHKRYNKFFFEMTSIEIVKLKYTRRNILNHCHNKQIQAKG